MYVFAFSRHMPAMAAIRNSNVRPIRIAFTRHPSPFFVASAPNRSVQHIMNNIRFMVTSLLKVLYVQSVFPYWRGDALCKKTFPLL